MPHSFWLLWQYHYLCSSVETSCPSMDTQHVPRASSLCWYQITSGGLPSHLATGETPGQYHSGTPDGIPDGHQVERAAKHLPPASVWAPCPCPATSLIWYPTSNSQWDATYSGPAPAPTKNKGLLSPDPRLALLPPLLLSPMLAGSPSHHAAFPPPAAWLLLFSM